MDQQLVYYLAALGLVVSLAILIYSSFNPSKPNWDRADQEKARLKEELHKSERR